MHENDDQMIQMTRSLAPWNHGIVKQNNGSSVLLDVSAVGTVKSRTPLKRV